LYRAGAVTVELVLDRPDELGARRHRALGRGVYILHVEMDVDGAAAARLRSHERHLGIFVGKHDARVADADLGVAELAVGPRHAHHLGGAERLLVELDRARPPPGWASLSSLFSPVLFFSS
jgi:hypothetical protein